MTNNTEWEQRVCKYFGWEMDSEQMKEFRNGIKEAHESGRKQERREIVEMVKGIEKKNGIDGYPPEEVKNWSQRKIGMVQGESLGYNQCASDIIQNLTNKE